MKMCLKLLKNFIRDIQSLNLRNSILEKKKWKRYNERLFETIKFY